MIEMTSTKNTVVEDGISPTLTARMGTGGNQVNAVMIAYSQQAFGYYKQSDKGSTLKMRDYKDATDLIVGSFYPQMKAESQCWRQDGISNTLINGTNPGFQNGCLMHNLVRRLTPLECERLQGYPDGWTDIGDWIDSKGKKHKAADSPRYKALGNSIALPFWFWLLRRISAQYERPATLGSLFDGIGGFPLCWERCNGIGTARWASEIEEFPIAVTKKRFKEVGNEK